jgi:large subunit ribosomal protein L9
VELILIKDVPNLGLANEVIKVKDGYARNYLLPQHLAVVATAGVKKERSKKIERAIERKKAALSAAQELAERIGRLKIEFVRKSSDDGRLFGSVTKEEIVDAMKSVHLIELERRMILLIQPLKSVGEHVVKLKFDGGVFCNLMVHINAEGAEKVKEKKPEQAEVAVDEASEQA